MSRDEWLSRYRHAFVDAGLSPLEALEIASAVDFEDASRGFEEDPEGAAQEEMSYWD